MRFFLLTALLVAPAAAADYDSEGRRDPFVPAMTLAAEAPAWDQVRPTAVFRGPIGARALLVGGPAAQGVLVKPGDALGEATVGAIDVPRRTVVLRVPEPRSLKGFRTVPLTLR